MIVLDRDVLVELRNFEPNVIRHLQQYTNEDRTIPSHVKRDFDNLPLRELADVDIVHSG